MKYTNLTNEELVERMIVRRIFRDYLDGYNIGHIVERLKADSIDGSKTTANGFDVPRKWNYEGLDYLLQNEKYPRDAANASLLNPTDRGGERAYS